MKRVLFDGTPCQQENDKQSKGACDYTKRLLREALDRGFDFDIVLYNGLGAPNELAEVLLRIPSGKIKYVENREDIYNLVDKGGYDQFFTCDPAPYFDYPCNTKMICVVQGLRSLESNDTSEEQEVQNGFFSRIMAKLFPNTVSRMVRKRRLSEYTTLLSLPHIKLIASTEHTKYALVNLFPTLQVRNVRVFYPQFSLKDLFPADIVGKYFLMVNATQNEKETLMALEVLDRLFSENRLEGKHVIVTGCQSPVFSKRVKNREKFLFLPYVPADVMAKFYREAFCLLHPSQTEGFALTPVKAMACGVPVIAAAAKGVTEVCGASAAYFAPDTPDELANRILQVTYNDWLRNRMHDDGLRRVDSLMDRQQREISQCLKFIFE